MTELYFTCDWIIRPAVNYVRLEELGHETGCELAIIQAAVVTLDRFVQMRFALRAPSQAAFDDFKARAGAAIGLDDWQPSSPDVFTQAQPMDLHLLDADFLTRWMEAMHAYGLHNAALRQQQEEENHG